MQSKKYIPFSEQDRLMASKVDLVSFLQLRGEKLERVGKEHKLTYTDASGKHDSITVCGNRWYDHKNQVGGGPVKFLREHYGMSYQEAMLELLGGGRAAALEIVSQKNEPQNIYKKDFKLPDANDDMRRVFAYLTKQRFIAPDVISFFAHQRKIYEDRDHHNAVFVGMDENGVPKQASLRSTISFGNAFRITVSGSDTKYSFSHFGESGKLFVFEAPIDMLSFITLYQRDWQHSYIAMNGVYENAVLEALKCHSNLDEVILCTDNDVGGIDAADRLRDILHENGCGWGKSIVADFSAFLQNHYPTLKGFSPQNIWRMKQFYETYHENEKLSPLVREISWTSNLIIMSGCKTDEAREFYLRLCITNRYTKRELERQIGSMLYERTMISNEKHKELIGSNSGLASLRDSYVLEFLDLGESYKEKDLRKQIVSNLKNFILEFGHDFTFMGEEYRVQVGNTDFSLTCSFITDPCAAL